MHFETDPAGHAPQIADLYRAVFTASEGPQEGGLIANLAARLMAETAADDIAVVTTWDGGAPIGATIWSRMVYAGDARQVFVLAPVAVATQRQGAGIGRAMIGHGLAVLRARGVDVALTYGDPAYYARCGFAPISEDDVPAPYALQYPQGWLGQSLSVASLLPLIGPARCCPALADPAFW